ncbi:leucine-rich colipase-like protein 1 isoform X2 [Eleutherodactylus coqui]|uniref:leucine-rich colipase-like protein 1 isoform X2 n=1 Tax=Eleutherodactylus coqui TaxID=57060 RepID=UPI003462AB1C
MWLREVFTCHLHSGSFSLPFSACRLAVNVRVVAIAFITADMAQHRIMTILLFVYLSLCFEVAQSELKKDGDPCIYSDDCKNRCCHRDSPKGSGKCVQKSMRGVRCYGPNFGDFCYSSDQCHSGCCHNLETIGNVPICLTKSEDHCFGADNGDYCTLNTLCKSGCCRGPLYYHTYKTGKCRPKAAENKECNLEPVGGLYRHCPCESGLLCEKGTSRNTTYTMKDVGKMSAEDRIKVLLNNPNRRICKKPNTANN